MAETVSITIQIPRRTWEAIQRATKEMQDQAQKQGMEEPLFDPLVHTAILLEQAMDMHLLERLRPAE